MSPAPDDDDHVTREPEDAPDDAPRFAVPASRIGLIILNAALLVVLPVVIVSRPPVESVPAMVPPLPTATAGLALPTVPDLSSPPPGSPTSGGPPVISHPPTATPRATATTAPAATPVPSVPPGGG